MRCDAATQRDDDDARAARRPSRASTRVRRASRRARGGPSRTATRRTNAPRTNEPPNERAERTMERIASLDATTTTNATTTTTTRDARRARTTLRERYAPKEARALTTPAKKLEAVRAWLAKGGAMCASGPPGCGKASAIKCVAKELGYEVSEWKAPTPTLWREHAHARGNENYGMEYASKVDEFAAYVARATKYEPLSFLKPTTMGGGGDGARGARNGSSNGTSTSKGKSRGVLLMVRDIPSSDESGRARVLEAIRTLATARNGPPCAVVLTEEDDGGGGGGSSGRGEILARDVRAVMEQAGATCINFNATTAAAMTKTLLRVRDAEGFDIPDSEIDAIVQASHGDLRSALGALEFWCMGKTKPDAAKKPAKKAPKRKRGEPKEAPSEAAVARAKMSSRDQGLGLFHALGKFLYNKRETTEVMEIKGFETMDESLRRPPARYDPEEVLSRSGIGAETAVGFLFENFPDFIDSRCIAWVAAGTRYLSDAAILARGGVSSYGFRRGREDVGDEGDGAIDPNVLGEYTAGSVATRGVLFSSKRSSAGFLPMRGPSAMKNDRAAASNREEVRAVVAAAHDGDFSVGGTTTAAAIETLPALRLIAGASSEGAALVPFLPARWRSAREDDASFRDRVAALPRAVAAPLPAALASGVALAFDRGAKGAHAPPLTLDDIDDLEDDIESDSDADA